MLRRKVNKCYAMFYDIVEDMDMVRSCQYEKWKLETNRNLKCCPKLLREMGKDMS